MNKLKLLYHVLHRVPIAWLVLAIALMATGWGWFIVKTIEQQHTKSNIFEYREARLKNAIISRMRAYQQMLQSTAGLFIASTSVERYEWRDYVEHLQLNKYYPGIQGVGFAQRLLPSGKAAHIATIRAEGGLLLNYTLRPAGEREEYAPIIYIEPLDERNQRALGYDMFTEPTRRAAMEQARDTGEPALSGKVKLVQETDQDIQAGCLLYVPVYRKGQSPHTVAERRTALVGYVYSPFRMKELMRGIFGTQQQSGLDFEIYDGENPNDVNLDRLLYDEVAEFHTNDLHLNYSPQFTKMETLVIAGHSWIIHFATLPQFEADTKIYTANIILFSGLVTSLLLFGFTRSFETARALETEQQAEKALRQGEAKYRQIVETAQEGIWIIDAHQANTTYVNARMAEMLGYSETEMLGKPVFNFMDDTMQPEALRIFEHRSPEMSEIHDFCFRRKDGSNLWVIVSTVLMLDQASNVVGSLNMITDISKRKQMEVELQQAKEAAEVANRAKSTFLANMSHELRTPLNGILGYTQILSWDDTLTEDQQEGIHIIEQSGQYLLTLINDILDLAKIEANKIELSPTAVFLNSFLQEIVQLFQLRTQQQGIHFVYQPQSKLPVALQVDEKRLRQILINLLGNAVKFTARGSVTLTVTYEDQEENLHVQVADTGCGIATADLEKIFLPFQQVGDHKYWEQGTGLGLPITKTLVEMMGSKLHVTSILGQGSTFWMSLKLPKVPAVSPLPHDFRLPKISGYQGPPRTVLVIDDNDINRSLLIKLLAPLGFTVLEATNGQTGLDKAREMASIDLILIDLVLPDLDGFSVIQQLRQLPQCQHTVLITVSASAFESDRQHSIDVGGNDFLAKPINLELLLEQLGIHLNLTWCSDTMTESAGLQ
jgi:PAS domain S-box-containing protein